VGSAIAVLVFGNCDHIWFVESAIAVGFLGICDRGLGFGEVRSRRQSQCFALSADLSVRGLGFWGVRCSGGAVFDHRVRVACPLGTQR
jgi:hypothetical protein